jgi:hypothetical protein
MGQFKSFPPAKKSSGPSAGLENTQTLHHDLDASSLEKASCRVVLDLT